MQLIRKISDLPDDSRGGALTIGNFDGVHLGHKKLIDELNASATELGRPSIVFTFDPHPVRILRPEETPPPLTWTDRKADLLAALGVDVVVAYPTDRDLLSLTCHDFFSQIVVDCIGAKVLVEGPNFYFGRNREGDIESLRKMCTQHQVELKIVEPELSNESYISSSRIRHLIRDGEVAQAARFLTQPYRIRGMVKHGAARGTGIGFPTANLGAIDTLIPGPGVYAGRSWVDGRAHWSAINIGPNPTFGENRLKVESHLLDYEGSLYGHVIELDFIERLRDTRRFDSSEELEQQLQRDIADTRSIARRG